MSMNKSINKVQKLLAQMDLYDTTDTQELALTSKAIEVLKDHHQRVSTRIKENQMDAINEAIGDCNNISVANTLVGFDVFQWHDDLNDWRSYGRASQSEAEAISSILTIKGQ